MAAHDIFSIDSPSVKCHAVRLDAETWGDLQGKM